MASIRIIGDGRAGGSFALALRAVGHDVDGPRGRTQWDSGAAHGVDALVLAVPDDELAMVALAIETDPSCAVLHLSGSLGPDVLAPHPRRGAMHPLVPLPTPAVGAQRLRDGVTMAVAGDALAESLAASLGARLVRVRDEDRALYHAAACVAANHTVALLGQVERIAAMIGLDLEAFLGLASAALADVASLGPGAALTGPAARGDWATIARHLEALPAAEREGYGAGVALALELAGTGLSLPPTLATDDTVTADTTP